MKKVNEYMHESGEYEYDPAHGPYQIGAYFDNYIMYLCPVCNRFTIELVMTNSFETNQYGVPIETKKVLYPSIDTSLKRLPHGVREAFQASLKVRHIDGAVCAIAIRRTLEKMCKDKNAEGKGLYNKLKFLSENGTIPPILDEMSNIIKDIGNEAAHADDIEFDDVVISSLIRFTEIILEYVYVLPKEIKRIQFDMSSRKEEKEAEKATNE